MDNNGNTIENALGMDGFQMVCDDPVSGQSLTFMEQGGQQIITYQESVAAQKITLTDTEALEITAWRNNGRRNSYWNWPGLDAVRERAQSSAS